MPTSTDSLTPQEELRLTEWCLAQLKGGDERSKYLAKLVLTLYSFGMHPVCLARRHAFDMVCDGQYLSWERAKTRSKMRFPIPPLVREWLPDFIDNLPTAHPVQINQQVREAAKRMGLPGLTPRTLRHTVASRLLEKFDLNVAKSLTGTSDRILLRYARRAAIRSALSRISDEGF